MNNILPTTPSLFAITAMPWACSLQELFKTHPHINQENFPKFVDDIIDVCSRIITTRVAPLLEESESG